MRVLLLYPLFPKSFWSFEKTLELLNRRALLPPLGLITVAALLPQEWEFRLRDRNIEQVSEADWEWAELVIVSAMIVQKQDFCDQIQEAKRRGKPVAVGGPYATALPHEAEASGADYMVLDEGEITLPLFVEALARGEKSGVFRSEGVRPDVTTTPIPRYDLLDLTAYHNMSVQFSRGCPFQCEFCDIIVLYGRKPRTKEPAQLLAELDKLYELGWRGTVFMVDDNFIGNKRNVKLLLKELKVWQEEHKYPFAFTTEASIDLADDPELMEMMLECYFGGVFLGIETPDEDSLSLTRKFQNTRSPMTEAVEKITRTGLRVMAGFIIGFDGEKKGAGDRIVQFVEETAISSAFFSMLQALPDTALWHRLKKEGRLRGEEASNVNQTTLMNFVPTRPIEDIAREYIDAFSKLYDPEQYLHRAYRQMLVMGEPRVKPPFKLLTKDQLKGAIVLFWRQGFKRNTRWIFWKYLASILLNNPKHFAYFLLVCAHSEHFQDYRQIVQAEIETKLEEFLAQEANAPRQLTEEIAFSKAS
jgi:radical SAM superfamily enzyme YgiQ (UPF0313 family)